MDAREICPIPVPLLQSRLNTAFGHPLGVQLYIGYQAAIHGTQLLTRKEQVTAQSIEPEGSAEFVPCICSCVDPPLRFGLQQTHFAR